MQINSLVEYIGGQDPLGQKIFKLEYNTPYTVAWLGVGYYGCVPKESVMFLESGEVGFIIEMFREVQPPLDINIKSLLKEPIQCK